MVQGFVLNGFKSIWFVGYRLVFMAFLIILSVSTALAEEAAKEETGKEVVAKQVSLSGDHQKQQFLAAKRVEARTANVSDDIFAAGQDLIFDTVSAEHIIAAGMSLNFSDITADDLVLAGGQMSLSGDVRDDVIAAVCPFCPMGGGYILRIGCKLETTRVWLAGILLLMVELADICLPLPSSSLYPERLLVMQI